MTGLTDPDDGDIDRFFAEHPGVQKLEDRDSGTFGATADWLDFLRASWREQGEDVPAEHVEQVLADYDARGRHRVRRQQLRRAQRRAGRISRDS